MSPGTLHQIANRVQTIRIQNPTYSFLPNLSTLGWEFDAYTDVSTHYIPLIGGPNLKTLSIIGKRAPPSHPHAVEAMRAAFETIPERYPRIQKLEFLCVPEGDWQVSAALSSLIASLPNLRHIETHTDGLGDATYVHITRLPNLAVYHTCLPSSLDHPALQSPPPIFPAIRDVKWEVPDLNFPKVLLQRSSSTQLEEVSISGDFSETFTAKKTRELFEVLKRQEGLRYILLDSSYVDPNDPGDFPGEASTFVINSQTFAPLLTLGNITEVFLQFAWAIDLDDKLVRDIALAWPRLTTLCLQPVLPLQDPPRTTLAGLTELARHCRTLQILGIPLNPILPTLANERVTPVAQVNLGIFTIFYWTQLPDSAHVAQYLLKIFPSISGGIDAVRVGPVTREVQQEWRSFRSFVEGYSTALAMKARVNSGPDSDVEMD